MADREPYHITVANLPQHTEGRVKIHGFSDPRYDLPKDAVLLFTHMEGEEAFCKVEGTDNTISIDFDTPLVEMGNDEWQVEAKPSTDDVAAA